MSDERIKALEVAQVQLQKDLSHLAVKQTEIFNQQIQLDKTMSSILAKLDAKLDEENQLTLTIRHLDDSVKALGLKLEGMPIEHNRAIILATDRIWDSMRKQDIKLQDFKDKAHVEHDKMEERVKKELFGTAKTYVIGIVTVLGICGVLIGVMYFNMKEDINTNSIHIGDHHVKHNGNGIM